MKTFFYHPANGQRRRWRIPDHYYRAIEFILKRHETRACSCKSCFFSNIYAFIKHASNFTIMPPLCDTNLSHPDIRKYRSATFDGFNTRIDRPVVKPNKFCLLYTSDAADE